MRKVPIQIGVWKDDELTWKVGLTHSPVRNWIFKKLFYVTAWDNSYWSNKPIREFGETE